MRRRRRTPHHHPVIQRRERIYFLSGGRPKIRSTNGWNWVSVKYHRGIPPRSPSETLAGNVNLNGETGSRLRTVDEEVPTTVEFWKQFCHAFAAFCGSWAEGLPLGSRERGNDNIYIYIYIYVNEREVSFEIGNALKESGTFISPISHHDHPGHS